MFSQRARAVGSPRFEIGEAKQQNAKETKVSMNTIKPIARRCQVTMAVVSFFFDLPIAALLVTSAGVTPAQAFWGGRSNVSATLLPINVAPSPQLAFPNTNLGRRRPLIVENDEQQGHHHIEARSN